MKTNAFFLIASVLLLAACPDPKEETKLDLGAAECVAPATLGYECPNGSCPDAEGCNWCGCDYGTSGNAWACTLRACVGSQPDAGTTLGCQTDADCGGGVCRFSAGCTASNGRCVMASESFFPYCPPSQAATATTACLCDGTTQKIAVDCSGVSRQFKNLGACK